MSSGKSSDFSDDDGARKEPSATGDTNAAGNKAGDPEDEEPSDDIGLMGDTDIRHAVEDFDSSNWTMDQLEVSCQTLLEECYASEDQRRRLLSAGMLKKLVETYPSALRCVRVVRSCMYRCRRLDRVGNAVCTDTCQTARLQGQ